MGEFCPLRPKLIFASSIAAHSRFAKAEEVALRAMHGEALHLLRDNNTLVGYATNAIPPGISGDRPLIEYLFDSVDRKGVYLQFFEQLCAAVVAEGRGPRCSQAWFYNIYSGPECIRNFQFELSSKIHKTFEQDIVYSLHFPGEWYKVSTLVLRLCKPYVGMCVCLKSILEDGLQVPGCMSVRAACVFLVALNVLIISIIVSSVALYGKLPVLHLGLMTRSRLVKDCAWILPPLTMHSSLP